MPIIILEWLAFGTSLACMWAYGDNPRTGSVLGLVCASLFITFGLLSGTHAATVVNLVFAFIHLRNLRRSYEPPPTSPRKNAC